VTPGRSCQLAALGIASVLGRSARETWSGLIRGDQSRLTVRDDLVPSQPLLVGEVPGPLPKVPAALRRHACRNNALAQIALDQIAAPLASAIAAAGPERVGVVVGSSTSGVASAEAAIAEQLRSGELPASFDYTQLELGGVAAFIAEYTRVTGPAYTVSTACSSGARAVASARALLDLGVCDAVIAGGVDSLCGLTANGFVALQAVSDRPSLPFSANRSGFTLGEAAALFLVTGGASGIQLLGAGESTDAHHMSAPHPEGIGAEAAMRAALEDAGLEPGAIAYVNLHGTGTPLNDAMESRAVARVFGVPPPCSSTKPLFGHTLGASGALELAVCWLLLDHRRAGRLALPPHVWDGVPDPGLPPLPLVGRGQAVAAAAPAALMSNSFGFGGHNCVLIVGDPR
jgi:3-oxoacyl-[acyl-carrier-protein] synthase-1